METFNDIDSDVTTFFKILRERPEDLLEQLALTPFSREELAKAVEETEDGESISEVEQARRFFVRAGQTRSGLAQEATPGRWAYCTSMSRRDMSGSVSRYYGRLEDLHTVAERLRRVQIENKPAIDVIKRYDSSDTLVYCDPPYPHAARTDTSAYGYEMSEADHRKLAAVLKECAGEVAISSYRTDLYDELFAEWWRVNAEAKQAPTASGEREECLYVNYEPVCRDIDSGVEVSSPGT